eukprot:7279849-Prymnesium_polylepis.1
MPVLERVRGTRGATPAPVTCPSHVPLASAWLVSATCLAALSRAWLVVWFWLVTCPLSFVARHVYSARHVSLLVRM